MLDVNLIHREWLTPIDCRIGCLYLTCIFILSSARDQLIYHHQANRQLETMAYGY